MYTSSENINVIVGVHGQNADVWWSENSENLLLSVLNTNVVYFLMILNSVV